MAYVEIFFFTYAIFRNPVLNSIAKELKHSRPMQQVIWITCTTCIKIILLKGMTM